MAFLHVCIVARPRMRDQCVDRGHLHFGRISVNVSAHSQQIGVFINQIRIYNALETTGRSFAFIGCTSTYRHRCCAALYGRDWLTAFLPTNGSDCPSSNTHEFLLPAYRHTLPDISKRIRNIYPRGISNASSTTIHYMVIRILILDSWSWQTSTSLLLNCSKKN